MKYLQSTPFSVGLGSKAYSDGWERTFGKKDEPEPVLGSAKLSYPCHLLSDTWFCLCPHCEVRRREPGAPDECRRFDGCVCACAELPIP